MLRPLSLLKGLALILSRRCARRVTLAAEVVSGSTSLFRGGGGGSAKRLGLLLSHHIFIPAVLTSVGRLGCVALRALRQHGQKGRGGKMQRRLSAAHSGNGEWAADHTGSRLWQRKSTDKSTPITSVPVGIDVARKAVQHQQCLSRLHQTLKERGALPLPSGMDPDGLELMRFLLDEDIDKAADERQSSQVVLRAAQRVQTTAAWNASFAFSSAKEQAAWNDVVWWHGPGADGRRWLVLDIGRALSRCKSSLDLQRCANAVTSQYYQGSRQPSQQRYSQKPETEHVGLEQHVQSMHSSATSSTISSTRTSTSGHSHTPSSISSTGSLPFLTHASTGGNHTGTLVPSNSTVSSVNTLSHPDSSCSSSECSSPRTCSSPVTVSDRVDVVILGGAVGLRQGFKVASLVRRVGFTLNGHCPLRLRALWLVSLQGGVRRIANAMLGLLPPDCQDFMHVCPLTGLPHDGLLAAAGPEAQLDAQSSSSAQNVQNGELSVHKVVSLQTCMSNLPAPMVEGQEIASVPLQGRCTRQLAALVAVMALVLVVLAVVFSQVQGLWVS